MALTGFWRCSDDRAADRHHRDRPALAEAVSGSTIGIVIGAYLAAGCGCVAVIRVKLWQGVARWRVIPVRWRDDWAYTVAFLAWPAWVVFLALARRRWERAGRPRT